MSTFHCAEYSDGTNPVCSRRPMPEAVSLALNNWLREPAENRCKRCEAKLENARFAGWRDARESARLDAAHNLASKVHDALNTGALQPDAVRAMLAAHNVLAAE